VLFEISVHPRGPDTVVVVVGDIDLASIGRFRTDLRRAATAGVGLLVDLRGVDLIDSLGIGVLVGLRRRVGPEGSVRIEVSDGPVARLLTTCGVTEILDVVVVD